jgi:hypothetical protein
MSLIYEAFFKAVASGLEPGVAESRPSSKKVTIWKPPPPTFRLD